MTIQEANVAHLRALDPERVYIESTEVLCVQCCDNDHLHGKGVVRVWPEGKPLNDALCLACAESVVAGWLALDSCDYVTIIVAR
jgi:hypothetical protein